MATYYSPRPPSIEPEATCSGLECAVSTAFDLLVPLAWIGVLGLLVGLTYLTRARERCDEERRRTHHEVRAFDEFVRRVRDVDVATSSRPASHSPVEGPISARALGPTPNDDAAMRAFREAYRDTVMSVPHYETEYGEALTESVAAEFDPDAAFALRNGARATPQIKRALLQSATDARDRRQRFLESIERESDSLERATETLRDVETTLERLDERPLPDRSFDELRETWRALRGLRSRLEAMASERQDEIRTNRNGRPGSPDASSVCAFLYEPLSCNHPVLAEATALLEDVETAERRLIRSLTARV